MTAWLESAVSGDGNARVASVFRSILVRAGTQHAAQTLFYLGLSMNMQSRTEAVPLQMKPNKVTDARRAAYSLSTQPDTEPGERASRGSEVPPPDQQLHASRAAVSNASH